MNKELINKNNEPKFLEDVKNVREIMVYAEKTHSYFKTTRKELFNRAEVDEIRYYITDKIFVSKRNVMVII